MNFSRFQSFIVVGLLFLSPAVFSQSQGPASIKTMFSADSLAGFDENAANNIALSSGYYGMEYHTYMNQQKRSFINAKYGLVTYKEEESYTIGYDPNLILSGGKYSSGTTNNAPCTNEDFESGNLSGWSASVGVNGDSQTYTTTPTPITMGPQVTVVSTPFNDPVVGLIPNSPFGGSKVAVINNTVIGTAAVVKLSQTFSVTPTNYLFDFAYWAVMQNASGHSCNQTPYMLVKIRNQANNLQACPNFSIVAPSTGTPSCAGIGPTTWTLIPGGGGIQTNTSWQKFSIDLATQYMNQNVTIEVIVAHCSLTGHYGYAYFDSHCNTMNLTVNGTQTLSMPTPSIYPQVICGTNATLTAPTGLSPYDWDGPAGTFTNLTSQTVTTSLPGSYTLNMSPTGICNPPMTKIINLQFVPPTTVTATPANLCTSGTNTSSTLSASGASQYTWAPGGSTLSSIVVTPTITTIYTLTAKTGTCTGTFTVEVTVNPDPNVSILSSNFTVCPGQSATLTAFGADTYVWNPGAMTGSMVVVTPPTSTTYTVIGTSSAGCTGTAATNINTSAAIILTLTPLSPTYNCPGTGVNIVAGGASSFTWMPGNLNNFFVTLSPTVTTIYTVTGASGACTNTANITLSVNPGPSITIAPSPTIVCPGISTTLTATAPTAVGNFTWAAPVSSNANSVVVTPTLAGGYSVSAKDAMSCVSTYTANPNISPIPTLGISPSSPTLCFGNSITLNASGAASYTWLPGNSNAGSISVSPTVNTTYTLIGANAAGCTVQATTIVTVVPLPNVTAVANPTSLCAGTCVTITPGGALTYTTTGGSLCPLVNTSYTVVGTDAAGCTSTPVVVGVTVNPTPTLAVSASPATICQGASSTLSVTGATSYTWSTGSNASSISVSPSVTTTYTVIGANAFGCIDTKTIQVTVTPSPTLIITPPSASICAGAAVTPTVTGAISYTWMPGGLTGAVVVLSPTITTTYTVTGSNGGCTGQNTLLVTVAPVPTINASASPTVICAGTCATLSATGATSYTYSSGSPVVCPVINSTYTVTGSNASGCISNPVVVSVSVNAAPTLSVSASPTAVCPGGSSNLSASGAVSYTWLPMNTNGANVVVTPIATTIYTVIGANATGCTSTATVSVIFVPTPTVTASATPTAICIGSTATLSALGASNYFWMPGAMSGANVFVNPTVTTTYSVTGTTSGCTGSTVVTLIVNPLPTLNITATPTAICAGSSATLTAGGAVSYTWNTGSFATSIVVSPLSTTNYSVTGTSSAGCVGNMASITLPVNALPIIAASASPTVICSGGNATLTAGGGISYTWQPVNLNGSPIVVNPSVPTTYTLSGSNGTCVGTSTVFVNVSTPPTILISSSVPSICAGSSAILSASGGVSYTWQPGGSNAGTISVSPGTTTTYTLFGANAAGCVGQALFTLFVQPNPIVTSSATPSSICAGASATLNAGGATTYSWLPINLSGATQVVTPSLTTTYTVIGNSNGCQGSSLVTVIVNPLPTVFGISTPTNICAGSSATLIGGGAGSYNWMPGSLSGTNVVVSPSVTTTYTLTGTTGACSNTTAVTVVVSPVPNISASAASPSICLGQSTTLNASGSSSFYTWMPGSLSGASVVVSPSLTTTYTVTGNLGICSASTVVTVFVNPLPTINAFASPASICLGAVSTLTANGASSYTWTPGNMTTNPVNVSPTATTFYTVVGQSAAGCMNSAIVGVTVNPLPSLSINASNNPICSGNSATLSGSGATSYSWSTGSNAASIVVSPALTTVYTMTGTSASGCSNVMSYSLAVNPSPTINIVAPSTSVCAGFSISVLATGAPSFTWLPVGSTANPLIDTPTGTTIYTVIGSTGLCTSSKTINITVVPLPLVTLVATPTAVCPGGTTTLTAGGALTYSWIPSLLGGSTFVDSPTAPTNYTVVGFDAAGCPNFATAFVNVLSVPVVTAIANSNFICSGSSATLTASGASNYTWNPGGQTGSSIVINPSSSVVYTVLGSNGACTGMDTIAINVGPPLVMNTTASSTNICSGSPVNLSATGAVSYTWYPGGISGANISDTPLTSTTYTVIGESTNGCLGSATIFILVNPAPIIAVVASPTTVCVGGSVSLTASGALTYTWSNSQTGPVITDTPAVSTTYSVIGTDANGCSGMNSVLVNVVPIPTISISPSNPSVCIGSSTSLTATGAINYTWLPSGSNGSVFVANPLVLTTYTVVGDNGGSCSSTATVDVFVNPLPANVTASSSGTVSCTSPTASLFGFCSDPNVSYSWAGPLGYSSGNQNPVVSGVWGDFTLTVTNNATGCSATATANIPSDNTIPLVNPVASGSITCAVPVVTITAVNTTTNPAYSWTGPSGFTSNIISPTISIAGDYTIVVTDLSSTCTGSAVVSVNVHTRVEATASITPASCTDGVSNNDGKINVLGFISTDKYDIVGGSTYTGNATYATAINIPTNGIITNNLANPTTTVAYTIRLFDSEGCFKDSTLYLVPVNCSIKTLGIAKEVSAPVLNNDGTYDVTYKVVVHNYDLGTLHDIALIENLATTFSTATSFTVQGPPSPTTSGLPKNLSFNGTTQTNLLQSSSSNTIASGAADTISFTVRVSTSLFFVPFKNSIVGSALNTNNQNIQDSSQAGLDPDPDHDNNPANNNVATIVSFTPSSFFGITKVGSIVAAADKTYDLSYTITVYNLGNDTVRNVSVSDSLFEKTIKQPAQYTLKSGPIVNGSGLTTNSAFDGKDDINLLLPSQSKLGPNTISSISFVINVNPGTVTSFTNSAYGSGLRAKSASLFETVSDTSDNGYNPDTDTNNVCNEPNDNIPTVLLIPSPTHSLFIPEGFSPNGDNINDLFIIQGLPTTGENSIVFYNRWGNKVYENGNYDNSWDGTSNAKGTLGKDKLPQGTYYYILDMKNSGIKPISGFITLEY